MFLGLIFKSKSYLLVECMSDKILLPVIAGFSVVGAGLGNSIDYRLLSVYPYTITIMIVGF
jgi:hypothetical protein